MKKVVVIFFLFLTIIIYGNRKRELSVFELKEKEARFEKAQLEAIKNNTQIEEVEKKENVDTETLFEDEISSSKPPNNRNKTRINKLVGYIKTQNPKLNENEIRYILNTVWKYSEKYDFNPYIALAVMNVESHFNHSTVSRSGARGLMQLMPFNFKEFGVDNSIEGNIKGGIAHLKRDLDNTNSMTKTLVCYNAGCSRLVNNSWRNIKETREYIPKVLKKYKILINL